MGGKIICLGYSHSGKLMIFVPLRLYFPNGTSYILFNLHQLLYSGPEPILKRNFMAHSTPYILTQIPNIFRHDILVSISSQITTTFNFKVSLPDNITLLMEVTYSYILKTLMDSWKEK